MTAKHLGLRANMAENAPIMSKIISRTRVKPIWFQRIKRE